MTPEIAILVTMLLFGIALVLGAYIHVALLLSAIIGIAIFAGTDILPGMVSAVPYERVATYSLSTIPMFILMSQFILQSGAVRDIFYVVNRLSGDSKLALSSLTTISGGFLGAVSGSGTASSAAMARVAVPELVRAGYSKPLGGSIIAAAGSLSAVIPPSVVLIIYGAASETPISDLFMAALVPGVLSIAVIVVTVLIVGKFDRTDPAVDIKPDGDEYEPNVSNILVSVGVLGVVATTIFGGIYFGVVTPTESGALGAFVAFIGALLVRKVNKRFLVQAFSQTVLISGMIMLIMIAAQVFARFVSLSMLPRQLVDLLGPLMDNPTIVLIILFVGLFLMFMVLEGAAVVVMTIPVLMPILIELQVDLVWFGVVMAVLTSLGLITPPLGLNVYAVSVISNVNANKMFVWTSIIAVFVAVVVLGLLLAFPNSINLLI